MIGTWINIATIIIGGVLGLIIGRRFPENIHQTVVIGLGLFTSLIGVQLFLETTNAIIVLGSILLGSILGELIHIERHLMNFGQWAENQFYRWTKPQDDENDDSKGLFAKGLITASLLFCIGPMTILGSIQDGISGDYQLLAIKSVLDGFASLAFASTMGIGVIFSVGVVFIYQGSLTLFASFFQQILTETMMAEMTATGGVLLLALAISSLLQIKKIRVGNLLPALIIAPIIAGIVELIQ